MTSSDFVRRTIKLLAALAVAVGVGCAFMALLAGSAMGGAVLQGQLREDTLRMAFIILPLLAAFLFVWGVMRDRAQPTIASAIYGCVVLLVAAQLVLPTIP